MPKHLYGVVGISHTDTYKCVESGGTQVGIFTTLPVAVEAAIRCMVKQDDWYATLPRQLRGPTEGFAPQQLYARYRAIMDFFLDRSRAEFTMYASHYRAVVKCVAVYATLPPPEDVDSSDIDDDDRDTGGRDALRELRDVEPEAYDEDDDDE